ncbi:MAG: hypothetical protein OXB89_12330 [Anaerolineaceae bacterium]|nr:hypothetical protein [Anaerolineaceae bacterium]
MITRLELSAAIICISISGWVLLERSVPLPIMLFFCIGLMLLPHLMSEDSQGSSSL